MAPRSFWKGYPVSGRPAGTQVRGHPSAQTGKHRMNAGSGKPVRDGGEAATCASR